MTPATREVTIACRMRAQAQALDDRGRQLRRDTIALAKPEGGYHFGGSFSCVEILRAVLDHEQPGERFIMSKGHACWPFYVMLREDGLSPKLEGHPRLDPANGVHYTTGSEGHGLPAAVGMAMARRLKKNAGRIIVLLGDGECQEGTTWESMLLAVRHECHLTAVVDCNGIQGSGFVRDILPIDALADCAWAIGWDVSIVNGHSVIDLRAAIRSERRKPRLVLAQTIKGKGVSFMEDKPQWHAKWLDDEHEKQAMEELK
jgi:transketolase